VAAGEAPRPDAGERLEEVRKELRRLGYLEGPLERFIVRDLYARPQGLGPALTAATRLALLGGPLASAAMTVAQAARAPALLGRPWALLAVFLYSLPPLVVSVGVVVFLVLVAALSLPRLAAPRRARLGRAVLSAIALGYVLVWWWLGRAAGGVSMADAAIVAAALLAAWVLGWLAELATLAVVLGAVLRPGRAGAAAERAAHIALGATALTAAGVVAAILVADVLTPPRAAFPAHSADGRRVLLVAVDGFGWNDAAAVGGGETFPGLARLWREGARMPLAADGPRVPPVVWTTIATGRRPHAHGVEGLVVPRVESLDALLPPRPGLDAFGTVLESLVPGRPATYLVPLSDRLRREKAFFEVFDEAGVSCGVVNWWGTWPARGLAQLVVSDRAYAMLAAGLEPEGEVAPPQFVAALHAVLAELPASATDPASLAERSDLFHGRVAENLWSGLKLEVVAVYFQAPDVIRNDGPREAYGQSLAAAERLVAHALATAGSRDTLVLVGDAGRRPATADGARGVLVLWGPGLKAGGELGAAAPVDIAPTLYALLGVPLSAELEGVPAATAFVDPRLNAQAAQRVPSYGRRGTTGEARDPASDAATLERLRALGYLQ